MKKEFISKIMNNAIYGAATNHGAYTYKANVFTGEIFRCRRGDEEREWIANDGNVSGAWTLVANA